VLRSDEYGVVFLLITVAGVVELLCKFALNSSMLRLFYLEKDSQARRLLCATYFSLQGILTIVILLGVCGFAEPINGLITKGDQYVSFFILSVIGGGLRSFLNLGATIYRIEDRVGAYFGLVGGSTIAQKVLIAVLLLFFDAGLPGYFWATMITNAISFLFVCRIMLRVGGLAFSPSLARTVMLMSLPLTANQFFGWIENLSDRIVIRQYFDATQVAVYGVGYTFGMITSSVVSAFFAAWPQVYYRRAAEKGDDHLIITRDATYLFAVCCCILVITAGAGGELISIMTHGKEEYASGRTISLIVGIAYTISSLTTFNGSVHVRENKSERLLLASVVSALANLLLNLWLVPIYGIIAAAWNTLASICIGGAMGLVSSLQIYPLRFELLRIGKIAVASAMLIAVFWHFTLSPTWLALLLKVLLAPPLFFMLLLLLRFFKARELSWFASLGRRLRRAG
jgi:O-antigen/teichoic acid export membrane protein